MHVFTIYSQICSFSLFSLFVSSMEASYPITRLQPFLHSFPWLSDWAITSALLLLYSNAVSVLSHEYWISIGPSSSHVKPMQNYVNENDMLDFFFSNVLSLFIFYWSTFFWSIILFKWFKNIECFSNICFCDSRSMLANVKFSLHSDQWFLTKMKKEKPDKVLSLFNHFSNDRKKNAKVIETKSMVVILEIQRRSVVNGSYLFYEQTNARRFS